MIQMQKQMIEYLTDLSWITLNCIKFKFACPFNKIRKFISQGFLMKKVNHQRKQREDLKFSILFSLKFSFIVTLKIMWKINMMKLETFLMLLILKLSAMHSKFETVAIACTNDIHGHAISYQTFRADTKEKYKYGGLIYMAQMIQTLKQEFDGRMLYLDAGDQFEGGFESSSQISSGQIINNYFNQVQVDASALGNHQFDFGPNFLFHFMRKRHKPSIFLSSNLHSEKGQSNFLPKQLSSKLFKLSGGIKIGVIGLTTTQTQYQINIEFPSYQFLQYAPSVQRQSSLLRAAGAHAIILLSHLGDHCNSNETFGIWQQQTPQNSRCLSGDIITLLKAVPKGTIDAVVQGHVHTFSHHFIDGIPIAGTINGGAYFNIIYLHFIDRKLSRTTMQGPVPVCQKVFQRVGRCGYLNQAQLKNAGSLVKWKFHGKTVYAHQRLKQKYEKQYYPLIKPFLTLVVHNQRYLANNYYGQSELAKLIFNLVVRSVESKPKGKVDFGFFNPGVFRSLWLPGDIQQFHFQAMFPTNNNQLITFDMTGQELINTLNIIETGGFYYPTYGLKLTITINQNNGKKIIESAMFYNGDYIDPLKNYRGLSLTQLIIDGGFAFRNVIKKVYQARNHNFEGKLSQIVRKQLKAMGIISKISQNEDKEESVLTTLFEH